MMTGFKLKLLLFVVAAVVAVAVVVTAVVVAIVVVVAVVVAVAAVAVQLLVSSIGKQQAQDIQTLPPALKVIDMASRSTHDYCYCCYC